MSATERRWCDNCEEETLHRLAGDTNEFGEDWQCQPCRAKYEAEVFGYDLPTPAEVLGDGTGSVQTATNQEGHGDQR
mgnify:CR=1 FL=1